MTDDSEFPTGEGEDPGGARGEFKAERLASLPPFDRDPGVADAEWSIDEQRQIALGRSPEMMRICREHSPIGQFSVEGAAADGVFHAIDPLCLDEFPGMAEFEGLGGQIPPDVQAEYLAAMRRPHACSLDDIRAQLGEFVYGAIPAGAHVEGLVIGGPLVYDGWRRWAMRLGLWLLRRSGCEVVKP